MYEVKSAKAKRKDKASAPRNGTGAASENGNVRTTILIPDSIHKVGVKLATDRRRSFSNYITTLIEADASDGKAVARA